MLSLLDELLHQFIGGSSSREDFYIPADFVNSVHQIHSEEAQNSELPAPDRPENILIRGVRGYCPGPYVSVPLFARL